MDQFGTDGYEKTGGIAAPQPSRVRARGHCYPILTAAQRAYARECEIRRSQLKLHTLDWIRLRHTIPTRKQLAELWGVAIWTVRNAALGKHYKRRCPKDRE